MTLRRRRTRLTHAAKKSRRRTIVCGHFTTYDTLVVSPEFGAVIHVTCTTCHALVRARALTRDEQRRLDAQAKPPVRLSP